MKTNKELTQEFAELLFADQAQKDADIQAFSECMENSTSKTKGRTTPASPLPKLFNAQSRDFLVKTGTRISRILGRVVEEYLQNPEYRKAFHFDPRIVDLICIDPGYECKVPFGRFDVFYDEENNRAKFCEFNSDGSSGMGHNVNIDQACHKTSAMREFCGKHDFDSNIGGASLGWAKSFLEIYETFEFAKRNPSIAIVDFIDMGNSFDFLLFKDIFEKLGFRLLICDVRELQYDGRVLKSKDGQAIDAIMRRCVSTDVLNHWEESQNLIAATRDKNVALIGGFFGSIIHDKQTMAVLRRPETLNFLDPIDRVFVHDFVPVSGILTPDFAEEHQVFENPSKWVVKPSDLYASKNVLIGKDFADKQVDWQKALQEILDSGDIYLCQEFVEPYRSLSLPLSYDKSDYQKEPALYNNSTGIFMTNGKFSEAFTRLGPKYNVGTQAGAHCTATYFVK